MDKSFLWAEATQAWNHYRHLEETRRNYLAFHSATTLTSLGFLATIGKDIASLDVVVLSAVVSGFLVFLFVLSFFVWANLLRIGYVLQAYEEIMTETRRFALGSESPAFKLWNIRDRLPGVVRLKVFTVQNAANYLALLSCALVCIAQILLTTSVVRGDAYSRVWAPYRGVFIVISIAMVAGLMFSIWSIRVAARQRAELAAALPVVDGGLWS
ncbi:hypothetical protein LOC51_16950 [Rubrivivax sp. JA1024]|nr:hypothetical protein [Rubrivivax sp. JA1024]